MGGRISEGTLREIRERADIVEVVSEVVSLSRSGASFRGLCPFHREKTPSFFVHPGKQVFHCFGCGEGGSALHFVMKARSLSFSEAVEELADRYGIPVRYEGGASPARPREDLFRVLLLAAETYRDILKSPASGKAGREFLRRRGVTPDAEREFALGFGGSGKDLLAALSRAGVDPARAERAGLLVARGEGVYRERFAGRVIFPIADARGRVCGFGARAVDDAQPKYLNSPESDLYRKSAVLYGLFQALPAIREAKQVVVVEGYMDLIGLWQRGIRWVVATCGTSLTETHARALKRLSEAVILLYDGDTAGKQSAVRAGGPLYAAGVSPLALFPPKGMDPDDWARAAAPGEIAERIAKAVPLMESVERSAARKFDLSEIRGKLSYLRLMAKYLQWIGEPAERRLYVQRVARAAGLPEEAVLEQIGGGKAAGGGSSASREIPAPPGSRPEEDLLLRALARDPSLLEEVRRDGVAELLEEGPVREALLALAKRAETGGPAGLSDLLDEPLPDGVRQRVAGELARADLSREEARRIYPGVLLGLRIRRAERESARLGEEYRRLLGGGDAGRARELLAALEAARLEKERLERERSAPSRK
ncbi:MAG: DNA primase [Deltaproteobacteria bacterium]|nr:DNA primase [Deltaproteobacteria bacterium]